MKYDYIENMMNDIRSYIEENINAADWTEDRDGLEEQLNDDLFVEDSITGNASGSFYCNASKAREAVSGNEDLLIDALECFGDEPESYKKALQSPEYADVTIRCYCLGEALHEVLDELENEGYFDTADSSTIPF